MIRPPLIFLALTSCVAFAQQSGSLPSFEVASVKPAAPQAAGRIRVMMGGDPGMLNYSNVSLRDIIRIAYSVKEYQISGPDWLNSQRFDIVAKLPAGASNDDKPLMLQSLLAERFKLALHREKKELPAYALVVAKNGPKLKDAEPIPEGTPPPPLPGDGPMGGREGGRYTVGRNGVPQIAPGRGGAFMQMGRGHLVANRIPVSGFAEMLGRQLDRPVVDETGLKGDYDFVLDWTPEPGEGAAFGAGLPTKGSEPGPPPPPPGENVAPAAATPDAPARPPLTVAIQQQLGLKLETKKLPAELLVIDRIEKVPTEN